MNSSILIHPKSAKSIERFINLPPHAIGFKGEIGSGKGYLARYLAAQLLGIDHSKLNNYPYLQHDDALLQKYGIEQIREIQDFISLRVPGDKAVKRIVILENADYLGHEAQNAFLKTLEEPPEDTIIMLTYARHSKILETIHSRIQQIEILPVSSIHATQFFHSQYTANAIKKAYNLSAGQVGLLYALLEQDNVHPLAATINQARNLLVVSKYERLSKLDGMIKAKDFDPRMMLEAMHKLLNAAYRQQLGRTVPADQLKSYVTRMKAVQTAVADLDVNVQPKLVFSQLFIEF